MGSPVRAAALFTVRSARDAARRIPEDFVTRLSPGLEPDIRARLSKGMAILGRVRRLDRVSIRALAAGIAVLWIGFLVMGSASISGPLTAFGSWMESARWVFGAAIVAWAVALAAYLASALQVLLHAADVRSVWTFYEREQTSSLARDLA